MPTSAADATLDLAAVSLAVDRYFAGFNAEAYRAVAALFEEEGVLRAPFEDPIVGPEAIYAYLQAEAVNMRAAPIEVETGPVHGSSSLERDLRQVVVKGRVKTPLFTVNVRWTFVLTVDDAILSAEIKLLASLQELMQFDRN